jgi:hypothetical protein
MPVIRGGGVILGRYRKMAPFTPDHFDIVCAEKRKLLAFCKSIAFDNEKASCQVKVNFAPN